MRVDIRKWKDVLCYRISRINVVRMDIFPKLTGRFHVSLITELEKTTLKLKWNKKRPRKTKAAPGNKSKAGHITMLGLKSYF